MAERWPQAEVAGIELSDKGVEIGSAKLPGGRFAQFDLLSGASPLDGFAGWATHATCSEVLDRRRTEKRSSRRAFRGWRPTPR